MAYGFTDFFMVNRVTKQGDSLSPLKCTLTTSLGHCWIVDLLSNHPGAVTVQPHHDHYPNLSLQKISMIEAMDDSLLISSHLNSLKISTRLADRFQATYGWETEWHKSALYIYNVSPPSNQETLLMPATEYTNPQSDLTHWHLVPLITDFTTFLCVLINWPDKHFKHLCDIISNFQFPLLSRPLPLPLLGRSITQNIILKLQPLLAFQPISQYNTTSLDHKIASKVHSALHFPFWFKTQVLIAPLQFWGLDFPSILHLNSSLAVTGLL